MLTFGAWNYRYVYENRKITVNCENHELSVHLHDDRYSVVKAVMPMYGIQQRWYYRVIVNLQCKNLGYRLFVTWLDADGKELVKEHITENCRILVPAGAIEGELEVLIFGTGQGELALTSFSVESDCAYSPRIVRICSLACDMESRNCEAMPFAQSVEYQLSLIDRVAHLQPDVIVMTENVFQTLEDKSPQTPIRLDSNEVFRLREKARQHKTYIACSLLEEDPQGIVHNTAVLINRQGEIQNLRRKTHLTITELEKGMPLLQEPIEVFDTDFGRIGVLVCWEHYFPESARILTLQGAELLLIPTHGFDLSRAITRAMENGVYLSTAHVWSKDTVIIAPDGKVVDTGTGKGYAFAEIDLNEPKHIFWLSYPANTVPNNIYMYERRPELYGTISST